MDEAEAISPNAYPAAQLSLEGKIRDVLNCHSAENDSNTPDFILAQYLVACLSAFNYAVRKRESWYGRDAGMGPAGIPTDGRPIGLDDPQPPRG